MPSDSGTPDVRLRERARPLHVLSGVPGRPQRHFLSGKPQSRGQLASRPSGWPCPTVPMSQRKVRCSKVTVTRVVALTSARCATPGRVPPGLVPEDPPSSPASLIECYVQGPPPPLLAAGQLGAAKPGPREGCWCVSPDQRATRRRTGKGPRHPRHFGAPPRGLPRAVRLRDQREEATGLV